MSIKRLIFNTFHSLVIFSVFQFLLSFYIKTNLLRSERDEFNTGQIYLLCPDQIFRAGSDGMLLSIEFLPRPDLTHLFNFARIATARMAAKLTLKVHCSSGRGFDINPRHIPVISLGPVTRHSLLKWRIPVQNCLIILPLPPPSLSRLHKAASSPPHPFSIKPLQFLPF